MNFLETLLAFLKEFWPLAKVNTWQEGVYYVFGRSQRWSLKPGIYPVVPWFTEVLEVDVVPTPISTPLLNITLSDGKTLSYSITAIVRVVDPKKALNEIDEYKTSTAELISSKASEKLSEVDATRLEPEKRKRLLADLLKWVNEETQKYGVETLALRFTNFALNQRAYRILSDTALSLTTM